MTEKQEFEPELLKLAERVLGQEHVTTVGRWRVSDWVPSPGDGELLLSSQQLSHLELRAAQAVLQQTELIAGAELRFIRHALGLRQSELAQQLYVHHETVCRWETGAETIRRTVHLAMLALVDTQLSTGELPKTVHPAASPGGGLACVPPWYLRGGT